MAGYSEPWHRVREMRDNGPGEEFTHIAVDHYPGETDADNGAPVLESADSARLARAVACVNFLAGVPDGVLAGNDLDGALIGLLKAVLRCPGDTGALRALADRLIEIEVDSSCVVRPLLRET